MRKLILLVEAFALAAGIVMVVTINPQTGHRHGEDHCLRPSGWHRGRANRSPAVGKAVTSMIALMVLQGGNRRYATEDRWFDNARSRRAVYPTPCARPGGRSD
jgi:hypothetical protein